MTEGVKPNELACVEHFGHRGIVDGNLLAHIGKFRLDFAAKNRETTLVLFHLSEAPHDTLGKPLNELVYVYFAVAAKLGEIASVCIGKGAVVQIDSDTD